MRPGAVVQGLPDPDELDKALYAAGKLRPRLRYPDEITGDVSYNIEANHVSVIWGWDAPGAPFGVSKESKEHVSYRPTALWNVADDSLIVAGIGIGASTLVEVWEFGDPLAQVLYDMASGEEIYNFQAPPVDSKQIIWSDRDGAEGPVNILMRNHGSPGHFLLQFLYTKNVYSLNASNGNYQLLVPGSQFQVETGFEHYYSVDHPEQGYLYFLHAPAGEFYVMQDTQRVGLIDSVLELQGNDYTVLGFAEGELLDE